MFSLKNLNGQDLKSVYNLVRQGGLTGDADQDRWVKLKEWSLFKVPFKPEGTPSGYLFEISGMPVAFIACSYRLFKLGDRISNAVTVGDLVVHPDHRGVTGVLFTKRCIEYFKDDIVVGMHFSEAAGKIWAKFGAWEVAGTDITYMGILSINDVIIRRCPKCQLVMGPLYKMRISHLPALILRLFGKREVRRGQCAYDINYPYKISEADKNAIDALCKKHSATYDIGVYRNYDYLKWRYENHPLSKYHFFALRDGGAMAGIGVLKISESKIAQIHEVIYDPAAKDIERSMMNAAIEVCRKNSGAIVYSKIINPVFKKIFKELGFSLIKKGYNQYLVCSKIRNLNNIIFTYGDFKEN